MLSVVYNKTMVLFVDGYLNQRVRSLTACVRMESVCRGFSFVMGSRSARMAQMNSSVMVSMETKSALGNVANNTFLQLFRVAFSSVDTFSFSKKYSARQSFC